MCKNMMIAGIKEDVAKKLLWDFLITSTEFMTANDSHGLGYAAAAPDGLWGERWLDPKNDGWKYRKTWSIKDQEIGEKFKGSLLAQARYNEFGLAHPASTHAVLYHARMATCDRTIQNTHPFVRDGVALIHNGVIRNSDRLENITSTCDSETILNEYVRFDVMNNPNDIQKVVDKLEGYYCCGLLFKDKDGNEYMDIFRSNGAQLYAYWIKELDAIVFCTSDSIVRDTCKKMNFSYSSTFRFKEDTLVRINAKTGEFVSQHSYKTSNWSKWDNYDDGHWSRKYGGNNSYSKGGTTCTEKKSSSNLPVVLAQDVLEELRTEKALTTEKSKSDGLANFGSGESEDKDNAFYWQGDGYLGYGSD